MNVTRFTMMMSTALLLAGSVFAQSGRGGGPPSAEEMASRQIERLTSQLQLTETQKAQATTIFTEQSTALQSLQTQMREASTALRNAVKTTGLDADIERSAAQLGTVQGQMAAIQGKTQAKFRAILTDDQKAKLDAEGDRGMGFGPGGPGGPGRFGGRRD